jgi:polyhydroxyalkanoate synthesis regulator protein
METIVKYNNRKLYSKTLAKYVNLDYVQDLVNTDQKFSITAHKTGNDVTNEVLTQVVNKSLTSLVKDGTLTRSGLTQVVKKYAR